MSGVLDATTARRDRRSTELAVALRAQWRMIASVAVRARRHDDEGFEADLRLDPIVVKGSLEQQGYPRTPEAARKIEERRREALDRCVREVNEGLPPAEQIKAFSIID